MRKAPPEICLMCEQNVTAERNVFPFPLSTSVSHKFSQITRNNLLPPRLTMSLCFPAVLTFSQRSTWLLVLFCSLWKFSPHYKHSCLTKLRNVLQTLNLERGLSCQKTDLFFGLHPFGSRWVVKWGEEDFRRLKQVRKVFYTSADLVLGKQVFIRNIFMWISKWQTSILILCVSGG